LIDRRNAEVERMLRVIRFYIILIGFCLTSVIADETQLKSSEFIFKAEVTGINKEWGVDEGDPLIYANRAFTSLTVNILEYRPLENQSIDDDFRNYLSNNSRGIELLFEKRIAPDKMHYATLKKYKGAFGLGVQGEFKVSGKLKLQKIRRTIPVGLTGVREEIAYIATIDQSPFSAKEEELTLRGSWSVVAERTVEVAFSGDLLKAYRGVRTNGHKMYVVPNYQSCYHSILITLNEWNQTGKSAFDEWLSVNGKNLNTDIRNVWRYSEQYDQLEIYRNTINSRFKNRVNVTGVLSMTQYTLANGSTLMEVQAKLDKIEGPADVVQTKIQVVRLKADLKYIHKSVKDIYEKFPSDVKVSLNAVSYKTPEEMELSDEFTTYIKERVFEKNHSCTLESHSTPIVSILAHRSGLISKDVRGKVEVLIDLESITNALNDGSIVTEYRYNLRAVKGSLDSFEEELFENEKTKRQAQRIINFHTLYDGESL